MAAWIKMPLGMELSLGPGDFVLYGDPAPFQKRGRSPQYSAHVYCGQRAAWIKTALGTEVGLILRNIVFDVDPATPGKRAHPPQLNFGPCLLWPNGWMDEDAAWYESRPRPRPHCTRRGSSNRSRGTAAPLFSAHVYRGHGRPSQLVLSSCNVDRHSRLHACRGKTLFKLVHWGVWRRCKFSVHSYSLKCLTADTKSCFIS